MTALKEKKVIKVIKERLAPLVHQAKTEIKVKMERRATLVMMDIKES